MLGIPRLMVCTRNVQGTSPHSTNSGYRSIGTLNTRWNTYTYRNMRMKGVSTGHHVLIQDRFPRSQSWRCTSVTNRSRRLTMSRTALGALAARAIGTSTYIGDQSGSSTGHGGNRDCDSAWGEEVAGQRV